MCTFLSISYKDVLIRVLLFTYFKLYVVYVVCTVHGKKSNSKQTIAKKLCIELN